MSCFNVQQKFCIKNDITACKNIKLCSDRLGIVGHEGLKEPVKGQNERLTFITSPKTLDCLRLMSGSY